MTDKVVQPIVTIVLFLALCVFIGAGIIYPDTFLYLVVGLVGLWFGQRTLRTLRMSVAVQKAAVQALSVADIITTYTRPILTALGIVFWVLFMAYRIPTPEAFSVLVIGMIGWWPGEKVVQGLILAS